jgi:hypothetical protein
MIGCGVDLLTAGELFKIVRGAKQFCPPYGLEVFGISSAAGRSIQRWAFDANMLLE